MREHLTHKAGKFRFSEEYRKERVDLLLAQAAILNETVRNLPVLPDVVSRIEDELIRQFDLLSLLWDVPQSFSLGDMMKGVVCDGAFS